MNRIEEGTYEVVYGAKDKRTSMYVFRVLLWCVDNN